MTDSLAQQVAALQHLSTGQLRQQYVEVFGEPTFSRHRQYLLRRIAWRLQAQAEGGLSERAVRRAHELANDSDVRLTAPRAKPRRDPRLPTPGTYITRKYRGQTITVMVLNQGFEYRDHHYRSLSAVAQAVSGAHRNGFTFFELGAKR